MKKYFNLYNLIKVDILHMKIGLNILSNMSYLMNCKLYTKQKSSFGLTKFLCKLNCVLVCV